MSEKMEKKSERNKAKTKTTATKPPRILLAEDDKEMRALLTQVLRKAGYEVIECPDGIVLLNNLGSFFFPKERKKVDLIISDIRMPGLTGMEILEGLTNCDDLPPIILITAFGDRETHAEAERLGATAMFDKPFDIGKLVAKIRQIIPFPDF